ncbi:TonB-dependent siderophore receptor [Marinospirillum sp.]|uniref:TonB-dependent siderophore receptor n=1 Tax=Marinospirillum sp. TaxID=2183934 RepID=UPI00384FB6EF
MLHPKPISVSLVAALAAISYQTFASEGTGQSTELDVLQVTGKPLPDQEMTSSELDQDIRSVQHINLKEIDQPASRIEDLSFLIPGVQQGVEDSGFSTSLLMRGFPVTRPDFNGLPDIQRLFVRDLHTVDSVEVLSGPDAILRGISSPGGSIRYIGKRPRFEQKTTLGIQASSYAPFYEHNGTRLTLDTTGPVSDEFAYRLVAVSQDVDLMPNDTPAQRGHLLGGLTWQYSELGELRLESEYQENRQPYLFGTVITSDDEPVYDRYFADPNQESKRQYQRHAGYWEQGFDLSEKDRITANARYAYASVERSDELTGFWSILDDDTLSGYHTQVDDDYTQNSYQLRLGWEHQAPLSHQLVLIWDGHQGDYTLDRDQALWDFDNNDWAFYVNTADPYQLLDNQNRQPTTPEQLHTRSWQDKNKNTTQGLAFAYQMGTHWGWREVDWTVGLRHNTFEQRYARDSDELPVVMDTDGLSWQWGFNLELTQELEAHLAQGLSRQVAGNTRRDRNGTFLPPEENLLTELGVSLDSHDSVHTADLALYHLERGKIAESDESLSEEEQGKLDFTPYVLTGSQTSVGIESQYRYQKRGWNLGVQASYLETSDDRRDQDGRNLPGIANTTAGAHAAYKLPINRDTHLSPWYSSRYVGERYADSANEISVDAYAVHSLGLNLVRSNTRFSLALSNILDEEYISCLSSTSNVYQGERRRIWISAEATF